MRQATLDILDASLRADYTKNLKKPPNDHFQLYSRTITVSPKYWKKYHPKKALTWNWTKVRYRDLENHLQGLTSASAGIYYFYVRPDSLLGELPQFVFYVGISGEHGSNRPLKTRLRDYLRLDTVKKRDAVHLTLQQFYPCVWVAYALPKVASSTLETLEKALHGYFQPWANDRDFPVEIKKARKAWRR